MTRTLILAAAALLLAAPAFAKSGTFGRSSMYDTGNPSAKTETNFNTIEPAAGPVSATAVSGTMVSITTVSKTTK